MGHVKEETEGTLQAATKDMKQYYDAHHQPVEFKPDDEAWLSAKDLMERPLRQLDHLVGGQER